VGVDHNGCLTGPPGLVGGRNFLDLEGACGPARKNEPDITLNPV